MLSLQISYLLCVLKTSPVQEITRGLGSKKYNYVWLVVTSLLLMTHSVAGRDKSAANDAHLLVECSRHTLLRTLQCTVACGIALFS